jgi:hypothetical protein
MYRFGELCEQGTATPPLPAVPSVEWSLFPNPFNPSVTVRFDLGDRTEPVSVRVVDLRGRLVRTLLAPSPVRGTREVV